MVGLSGFTFNHTLHMVVNDEENEDPNAKKIRRKSFLFYNDLCEIWGNDKATGEFAEARIDAALGSQQPEVGKFGCSCGGGGEGDDIDTPKLVAAPKKRGGPK